MESKKERKDISKDELARQLEEAKNKLAHYEFASEGASEGLWDRNLLNNEVFISPPWANMLGYKIDEIKQKVGEWERLMHPDDAEKAINALDDFIKGKKSDYNEQFRLKHKNGHYIWVQSTAKITRDKKGEPIRVSGAHRDITDKKRSEELIKASEAKYKHFFHNSLIGMIRVKTSDLSVVEINQKALNILALPKKGRYMNLRDPFLEQDNFEEFKKSLIENNFIEEFEAQFQRWDESITWVSISASKTEDGNGEFYDIIFRDISEFKENLTELQRLNFELDNFVYHASHDIRSPLRSLMGLIEILKTETRPAEVNKIIEMITGSINRLDKFVVDLLAMSRSNRIDELETVPVNFMIEINNSITNFHHVYTTKNLEIRTKVIQSEPFHSDLTKIRIILNNLISNSIKYRKNDENYYSYIDIYVTVTQEHADIKIEDNGEGIPKDKLEKIFDMFYRASESSEGSGLGMYIVKNVVKKLDAKIDVQSEVGKGTSFNIIVPNSYQEEN